MNINKLHEAIDKLVFESAPSERVRSDGVGLPYSEIQVTEDSQPNPFPCITIRYWPNGSEKER